MKLLALGIILISFSLGNCVGIAMQERDHSLSCIDCILKLTFRVAYSVLIQRSIASADDQDVVITLIYDLLNISQLLYVSSRKHFHPGRYMPHVQNGPRDGLTFFDQVSKC